MRRYVGRDWPFATFRQDAEFSRYRGHSDAPPQDGRASLSAQSGNGAIITPMRRFPPPWTIEEYNNACLIGKDATGQALGYFYFDDELLDALR